MILKPHISLNVTNIDASVAFYERAFGTAAAKRRPGYAKFDLASPALNLSMLEAPPTGVNVNHFGIQVSSEADVAEARARFERAGLLTKSETDVSCCYAVQDKVWIHDPDGNAWEVFVVKADAPTLERSSPSVETQLAPPRESAASSCGAGSNCCVPNELAR